MYCIIISTYLSFLNGVASKSLFYCNTAGHVMWMPYLFNFHRQVRLINSVDVELVYRVLK